MIFLAVPLICFAQEIKQSLQLTIKSDKEVYEVGEEINIEANIKNIGEETAKIYSLSYFDVSEIVVINSKGIKMKPKETMADINFGVPFITIPAGGEYRHTFHNLRWNSLYNFWGFFEEAKLLSDIYNIYVTITNPPKRVGARYLRTSLSDTLTSNTITIEVVEKK